MKPPARAIAGHLIWSTDGDVWALWRVAPFPHAHTSVDDKLAVHSRLRGLLLGLPGESMLLSVCERLDPWDVVADMLEGIDPGSHPAWADACEATADQLANRPLHRRRYYLAAALSRPPGARGWWATLRNASTTIGGSFGLAPLPVPAADLEARRRQARALEVRLAASVPLQRASAGEIRWLYARALRRGTAEPSLDDTWEPPARPGDHRGRSGGVLAQLTDAVVKEGGYRDDPDRPRHRRYIRIDSPAGTSYQTVLALADMPHSFCFPGGAGEWLYHADDIGFPVDWCVRLRSVPNAEAQLKVRRQHRQLIGQIDEYDGEVTGAPPSLGDAIAAVDDERSELAANPSEAELHATILFSVAAPSLPDLEARAAALTALFEPHEYGLGRPTGGQAALVRSMLPGTSPAAVCRDYTQFLLARDMAAGAPFCGTQIGDPRGALLAVSLEGGAFAPVLWDPTYGPTADRSDPTYDDIVSRTGSLAVTGVMGSGKSFLLKRLCWDTIARGGQIVTIDRTAMGEYVRFAAAIPGRAQIVQLGAGADVCLDPLAVFAGDDRAAVALGFLSLLGGCSPHTEEGDALAEAVDRVAAQPAGRLGDVVDELQRMGASPDQPDDPARRLARRLEHYRRLGPGHLAFGPGQPVSIDADLIVFWVPHLALPDRDTLLTEHLARQMLPEQILGHALLYLVAAVGRQIVFRDPGRFGAAFFDEAWALLSSPYGQRLLLEGLRDGRKHNGAIWLASQHPNDLCGGELVDLLGARFVFAQARRAIAPALEFMAIDDSHQAAAVLEAGLPQGRCLYRDVRNRVGLIQILEPALGHLHDAFDTTPGATPQAAGSSSCPADLATSAAMAATVADAAQPAPETDPSTRKSGQSTAGTHPNGSEPSNQAGGAHRVAAVARERARRRRRTPLSDALAERQPPP